MVITRLILRGYNSLNNSRSRDKSWTDKKRIRFELMQSKAFMRASRGRKIIRIQIIKRALFNNKHAFGNPADAHNQSMPKLINKPDNRTHKAKSYAAQSKKKLPKGNVREEES
jgi:hypothetical protein